MKRIAMLPAALCSLSLALLSANAQPAATSTAANPLSQAERAANLYGREILSSDNQQVGKIDNVVVDLESEHILYVVLNTSRGKAAVPPEVIGQSTGNTLRANAAKTKIESAPQFTSNNDTPQQLGQASFVNQVYQYFGQSAWWQGSAGADQGAFHNVHKLNQLIGMNVEDVNNRSIGKISNVVVDMPTGRLLYVVFSPAASLNLGNNLYAMPSDAFTLSSDQKHLVTGVDTQKLAGAPHFANNSWPSLTDSSFASQVYQYYGKQAWFNNGTAGSIKPTGR
ncbi:MAG TPA: PRC-barrel domain-containing protein [Verrucomicrobiae bacterium]|nr:PRC-barrel domain-containing protein [Verrucomicrobiae bacterium]